MRVRTILPLFLLLFLVACAGDSGESSAEQDQDGDQEAADTEQAAEDGGSVSIVDDVGRVVEIDTPVERAIAFNNYNQEFIRALDAEDTLVAASEGMAEQPDYWEGIDTSVTVGSQGEPNWEQVADSNPDVVIFPRNGAYEEAQDRLEQFGAKVVVITGWDAEKHVENVSRLGVIFGKEKEAEEFNDFYNEYSTMLEERLEDVERKPIYWETGEPFHTVVPGSGWHDMLEAAGTRNIFEDVTSSVIEAGAEGSVHSFEIDPEDVLLREPEIIVNRGHSEYESSSEELRQPLEEIVERPGWNELPAVQNGNVHSITRFAGGAVSKLMGSLYLAKWAYPEQFEDLDPDEVFQEWIEDFQGVPMDEPGSHTASL